MSDVSIPHLEMRRGLGADTARAVVGTALLPRDGGLDLVDSDFDNLFRRPAGIAQPLQLPLQLGEQGSQNLLLAGFGLLQNLPERERFPAQRLGAADPVLFQTSQLQDLSLLLLNNAVKKFVTLLGGCLGFVILHLGDVAGQNGQVFDDSNKIVQ